VFAVQALVAGPSKLEGTIKSFDENSVVVENKDNKYKIPKEFVAQKNLKAGAKIEILLSQEQIDKIRIEKKKTLKN